MAWRARGDASDLPRCASADPTAGVRGGDPRVPRPMAMVPHGHRPGANQLALEALSRTATAVNRPGALLSSISGRGRARIEHCGQQLPIARNAAQRFRAPE